MAMWQLLTLLWYEAAWNLAYTRPITVFPGSLHHRWLEPILVGKRGRGGAMQAPLSSPLHKAPHKACLHKVLYLLYRVTGWELSLGEKGTQAFLLIIVHTLHTLPVLLSGLRHGWLGAQFGVLRQHIMTALDLQRLRTYITITTDWLIDTYPLIYKLFMTY